MKKPKEHKTTHWLFGINVKDKDVVEVPEHLVSLFKAEGFEKIKEAKEEEAKEETKEGKGKKGNKNGKK